MTPEDIPIPPETEHSRNLAEVFTKEQLAALYLHAEANLTECQARLERERVLLTQAVGLLQETIGPMKSAKPHYRSRVRVFLSRLGDAK
jgi:hypothetical protein